MHENGIISSKITHRGENKGLFEKIHIGCFLDIFITSNC